MPPQQGEVALLTLFSDVHYFLAPPTQVPVHHRFDRGSYVYLYHDPIHQTGRLEIANNAGTPSQDAFAGQLDSVKIEQTYKHPCLFTLTVDAYRGQSGTPSISPHQDTSQWHLPAFDATNQSKYLFRLHTIDLYLWTPEDANLFLDSLRRVVQAHQLQVIRNPSASPLTPEHKNDTLSPVIARLENAAISHSSRSPSISTMNSFPGPPIAPPPASTSGPPDGQLANYAPMAYNPAAPAAPEPIAHREKTPPPPDAADGTGLGGATQGHAPQYSAPQYSNPLQASFAPQSTSGPYVPGLPTSTQGFRSSPGRQHTNMSGSGSSTSHHPQSFAPPPSVPPSGQYGGQSSPPPPPPPGIQRSTTMPVQQYANYPASPGFTPGPQSPPIHAPLASPGYAPQQQHQRMASPPGGGYSTYSYGSAAGQAYDGNAQSVHQQLYRPTEYESGVKDHSDPNAAPPNSNIGKRVEKMEKGVGRLLKKLDKKF